MRVFYPDQCTPLEFSATTRQKFLEELSEKTYDICVIGGGITGAGIARDAALRGLKVVLIEKDDFASGTSSKSSKLVHGGMRYLKQYKFALVHEALVERYVLMRLAPHLVSRLPCIFPIYRNARHSYWQLKAGMFLYDLLCGTKRIGRHRMLPAEKMLAIVPQIYSREITAGALYYDAKADDTRLVMATVQSAVAAGCRALNYVMVIGFETSNGRVVAVHATDRLRGLRHIIYARVFVNASGPWSDKVRYLADSDVAPHLRPTKGVHIVIPWSRLPVNFAIMLISTVDGRPFYTIPCQEQGIVMIGSTDTDFDGDFECVQADAKDIGYLITSFNSYFPETRLGYKDVISTFAGLRPLIYEGGKSPGEVSREHKIFESPRNLVHIAGGKLTTYRAMAAGLLYYLTKRCGISMGPDLTARQPLYGGEVEDWGAYFAAKSDQIVREFHLPPEIARYLLRTYGRRAEDILPLLREDAKLREPIVSGLPFIWAQIPYTVRNEMALSLSDFLIRRIHIFSLDKDQGGTIAPKVAQAMGNLLGWTEREREDQVNQYLREIAMSQKFHKNQEKK